MGLGFERVDICGEEDDGGKDVGVVGGEEDSGGVNGGRCRFCEVVGLVAIPGYGDDEVEGGGEEDELPRP